MNDFLPNRRLGKPRGLRKIVDLGVGRHDPFANIRILCRNRFQKRTFSGSIDTDQSDFIFGRDGKLDMVKQHLAVDDLGYVLRG